MNIAEVSVKRPVFAIMMTAALIVLGAVSYESLGLDLMPKTDAAVVSVQANLPGASAEEIETQITKRIEEAVNTISGIDELRASSDQGNSRVTIIFTLERWYRTMFHGGLRVRSRDEQSAYGFELAFGDSGGPAREEAVRAAGAR